MGIIEVVSTMGESGRIDWLVEQHDRQERRFSALTDLLVAKGLLKREEVDQLVADDSAT